MVDPDMKEVGEEIEEEMSGGPDFSEEPQTDNFMANAEIEIFLSTDGKHTVHLKTNESDGKLRKKSIAKTMELYDFILARYGTKQAQAVREYDKDNGKTTLETCPHTQFKFSQSKTEKNPGRWFKSCAQCGKFMGWQT